MNGFCSALIYHQISFKFVIQLLREYFMKGILNLDQHIFVETICIATASKKIPALSQKSKLRV